MIRREDLGRLKLVSMHLSQPWYTNTLGQWRQDPSRSGGGQLYDSGAHPLCSLCWTVDDQVAEVSAYIDRLDAPVDINGVVNVKFANGVLASVAIAGEGPVSSYGTWIFETGRVELNPWHAQQIRVWRITPAHRNGVEDKYPQVEGSDREPLGNFIDAILGRDEPRTTPRVGLIQSQLMDAIYESERTGSAARPRTVSPPPTIPSTPHGS
jgi:predicted dehydrogenase